LKDKADHDKQPASFHALHSVYHERDFRVRVNDTTIGFVRHILIQEIEKAGSRVSPTLPVAHCPACSAGYDFDFISRRVSER